MAVLDISKRYNTYGCYYGYNCSSSWNSWGRWVALAVIVVFAFFIFCAFSAISHRRRRRAGLAPLRGTAWVSHMPYNGGYGQQQQYHPNGQPYYGGNYQAPPPQYTPSNAGYYGPQRDVELQEPAHTYQQGGEGVYAPPPGPPPAKKTEGDGIIR